MIAKTPNPKPQTPNPKPQTPNPKPQTPIPGVSLRIIPVSATHETTSQPDTRHLITPQPFVLSVFFVVNPTRANPP
jgi:hypothetical protein